MPSEVAEKQQVSTVAAPWPTMALSEAIDINPKRPLPKVGNVPFLDMASLPLHGAPVTVTDKRPVSAGGARFQAGDTLFARITPCAENGKLGFVSALEGGATAQGSTEFIVMGARDGITLPEYVRWLSGWRHVRDHAIGLMEGTSGRQRIPAWAFDEIDVPVPPLDEQRRIAEVLRSVDEAIAANDAALAGVRAAKQGTMEASLSDGYPEVRLETLLADTRYPMRSGPFGSALLKSELQPQGIPFLGIDNVHVERFVPVYRRFVSEEKYKELARYTVFPGDVMVTIMGTVGRCCVVPQRVGTAISSKHVWTISIDQDRYSSALLAWQINHSPSVLEQLLGSAQGGIMSAISSGTLRDLRLPLPSPEQVREIDDLLCAFNAQIAVMEAEQRAVQNLKTALMSDLLSGRVRVPA